MYHENDILLLIIKVLIFKTLILKGIRFRMELKVVFDILSGQFGASRC